jgi:hypothetical protein
MLDYYVIHKHAEVRQQLADNPQVTPHFTPASCSWLNMVEIYFGVITRQAIRCGPFHSVKDLTSAIASSTTLTTSAASRSPGKDADDLIAKIRPSKN